MSEDDIWDTGFDQQAYEKSMARYIAPCEKHVCDNSCITALLPNYHEIEDIFDDFKLSKRCRERMRMEIETARGRDVRERKLIRQFVAPATGLYHLRIETASQPTIERMGDITFETLEDINAYYNYAIDMFRFDKALKIVPDDDPLGLFSASDEDDDLFGGLDDDDLFGDLFEVEDEDEWGDLFD